nr:hypothetical protein [Amycolatopsis sp. CA-126428]
MICGPRWAHELHELIPGARLVVLEHSGHFGHLEGPERFAESVGGLRQGLRRRPGGPPAVTPLRRSPTGRPRGRR